MEEKKPTKKSIFINLERFQSDCKVSNFNISNNLYRFFDIITISFLNYLLLFRVNKLEVRKRVWERCAMMLEC